MQGQEDLLGDVIPCFMVLFTRYNKCWCLYMYDMLNLTQIGLQRVENMRKIPKTILESVQNYWNVPGIYWKCSNFLQP